MKSLLDSASFSLHLQLTSRMHMQNTQACRLPGTSIVRPSPCPITSTQLPPVVHTMLHTEHASMMIPLAFVSIFLRFQRFQGLLLCTSPAVLHAACPVSLVLFHSCGAVQACRHLTAAMRTSLLRSSTALPRTRITSGRRGCSKAYGICIASCTSLSSVGCLS